MRAFFFGAGCSYGTLQNRDVCPTVKDFGKYLERINAWDQYKNLKKAAECLRFRTSSPTKVRLDDLWSLIDHYAKFGRGGFLEEPSWLWDAECELKRSLVRVYGTDCDAAASEIRTSGYAIVEVLKQVEPGDVIVSFNWDTLVERVAKTMGLRLAGARVNEGIRFVKPHGSVSWRIGTIRLKDLDGEPLLDPLPECSIVPRITDTEPAARSRPDEK